MNLSKEIYNLHSQKFTEFLVAQHRAYELLSSDTAVLVAVHFQPGLIEDVVVSDPKVGVVGPLHHTGHVANKLLQLLLGNFVVVINIKYSEYLQ